MASIHVLLFPSLPFHLLLSCSPLLSLSFYLFFYAPATADGLTTLRCMHPESVSGATARTRGPFVAGGQVLATFFLQP